MGRLHEYYPEVVVVEPDSRLARAMAELADALVTHERRVTDTFGQALLAAIPRLQRYAWTFARTAAEAEDLVQVTLLKAWESRARFERGTYLQAWLCTILRNAFLSRTAKLRREVADSDGSHAARLSTEPEQGHRLDLADVQQALDRLNPKQTAALLLIAVDGATYEEAAWVLGCAVGTVKSRVSRARAELMYLLGEPDASDPPPSTSLWRRKP